MFNSKSFGGRSTFQMYSIYDVNPQDILAGKDLTKFVQFLPLLESTIVNKLPDLKKFLVDNRVSATLFAEALHGIDTHLSELVYAVGVSPRSKIVKSQTATIDYSAAVPFIPAAYKRFHGVPYEAWNFKDECFGTVVGTLLADTLSFREHLQSIGCGDYREFFKEEVYDKNDQPHIKDYLPSCIEKAWKGSSSDWIIKSTGYADFDSLPKLLKLMVANRWVFSSTNTYVVHDPLNWDKRVSAADIAGVSMGANRLGWVAKPMTPMPEVL